MPTGMCRICSFGSPHLQLFLRGMDAHPQSDFIGIRHGWFISAAAIRHGWFITTTTIRHEWFISTTTIRRGWFPAHRIARHHTTTGT